MQAVLYYPFIDVPETAWLTRTLLYWDAVGTIVPQEYATNGSDELAPFTLDLVREGLIHQVFPEDVEVDFSRRFNGYLAKLSPAELRQRKKRFSTFNSTRIHQDKWLMYQSGLYDLQAMGLAEGLSHRWVAVEKATANEFMAALAAALCIPGQGWQQLGSKSSLTQWLPITDQPQCLSALLAGTRFTRVNQQTEIDLRIRGEAKAGRTRDVLLELLLPVPAEAMSLNDLLQFRKKHGALLPGFRRYLESEIDSVTAIDDPVSRQRRIDRLTDEVDQRTEQASAYLAESGVRTVARSTLLRWLRFIPMASSFIRTAQDVAEATITQGGYASEPLAYLGFARQVFRQSVATQVNPWTGVPLIDAITDSSPTPLPR